MSIFRRISDLFRQPRTSKTSEGFSLPFELTTSDYASLRHLKASDEWPIFLSTLDKLVNLHAEALLASNDEASVHFERGFISALRKVGTFINEVEFAEAHERHLKSQRKDAGTSDANRKRAVFGTPAWGTQRKS